MSSLQLKVSDSQLKTEMAKQKTFAMEVLAAKRKGLVELNISEKKAKLLLDQQASELLFMQHKQQMLGTLPTAVAVEVQAKTVRDIAKEENYWSSLSKRDQEDLVHRVGLQARKEQLVPLLEKVKELSIHCTMWDVSAYDVHDHSAIRGILLLTYKDLRKKTTVVPTTVAGGGGQRGIFELPGFAGQRHHNQCRRCQTPRATG